MPLILPFRNVTFLMLCVALPIAIGSFIAVVMPRLWQPNQTEVVVYTSLDEEFSQPIFDEFTRLTGIRVLAKFDTESTKTVGLTQALFAERDRPRCDLFWNNEIVNTLRLEQAGLLSQYVTAAAEEFPAQYGSASGTWHGFAARARVLIINTDLLPEEAWPSSIHDLENRDWQGRVGIAKPLAGTTATHAACLFSVWGEARAREFFRAVKANAKVMSGNKQVAVAVGNGELMFGLTDTDDAIVEKEKGLPVKIIYPDQGLQQLGTLFIPNTLALIAGAPRRESAEKLADFLLSPAVERMLAEGPSAQIPLNPRVRYQPRVESPRTIRAMEVDFEAAAKQWNLAAEFLRQEFANAD